MVEKENPYEFFSSVSRRSQFFTFSSSVNKVRSRVLKDAAAQVYVEMDNDDPDLSRRRATEKALFYYISSGDIVKVAEMLDGWQTGSISAEVNPPKVGEVSDRSLSQEMSMFISAITLFTRAAVDGGLPETAAYSLSDCYIRNALELSDAALVRQLSSCAMYDFTYEVYKYLYRSCSVLVKQCCSYIARHMHDPITLKSLSELTGRSANYISDSFARELGVRPKEFIRSHKLEYARHILEITDIPVSSLADLLAFPSASAFISDFRASYGTTPFKYRQENHG